ncbi:MAG TPA: OLD family endonuclease [Acidimicrobiaceae bacterium]|nr:OLD family endonuclease [Sphingorhabdus sp.]HAY66506.1 OLD family endonuclease [Acidimicrobiaceae bacterium]
MHHISSVRIENYRSIRDHKFPLSDFTALVGYNNAGKTSVLQAVNWLIKKNSLPASDFGNPEEPIIVTATISGIDEGVLDSLGQTHRQKVEPIVEDETIVIRRMQNEPGAAASAIKLAIRQIDEEGNETWSNPSGIDQAIAQLFPEPIFVGAMENATEDVGKFGTGTTVGKLIKEIMDQVTEAHSAEVGKALEGLSSKLSAGGAQKDEHLVALDKRIASELANFFPGVSARTHIPTPKIEDFFRGATIKIYEDGFENPDGRDAGSFGHGAQRSVQLALVTCLSRMRREGGDNEGRTTLLLIDEPELYLHPQAIEIVRGSLVRLAADGYQVLFTTHSPLMITRQEANKALLIRRSGEIGTHAYPRLEEAVNEAIDDAPHQAETLFALSNASRVLFSEKIILAEGKTEQTLLPELYAIRKGCTLEEKKLGLVALGGVGNVRNSMSVLQAMGIPVKAVVDLDYAFRGAVSHGLIPADHPAITNCKAILQAKADAGEITIGADQLPSSGNGVSASHAFQILAGDGAASPHIRELHDQLLSFGIWCWTAGAIEPHLGLEAKTASAHQAFLQNAYQEGFLEALPQYASVAAMLDWLTEEE